MFRLSLKHKIYAVLLVGLVTAVVYASQFGPERAHTGAPGDLGDCTVCHDDRVPANSGGGRIQIGNFPALYNPSQTYTLTVNVQDSSPGRRRWGFQLTAIDSNGNRAGTLAPLGSDTQIATTGSAVGDRQYIEHSEIGTFPGTTGGHTWQIRWTAPSTDVGTVNFFAAGNAADNSDSNRNDNIYTTNATSESPSTIVGVSLTSALDNQTLVVGQHYTITWSSSNQGSIDGYELRYSTDDGATFPISNLIFSTTDASVHTYDWTVPNKPTTQGRLRIQALPKSGGSPAEVRSGRFSISGSGSGQALPVIIAVSGKGNKIFVNGDSFQDGAVVILGSDNQKTRNDDTDPTHWLICKKAGKFINPGTTAVLKVHNPDGTESAPFSYFRPVIDPP